MAVAASSPAASSPRSPSAPPGATVGTVRANGLSFTYFEAGSGPLALLLHGFPDTPFTWSALMPRLVAAGYRVVAPFTRGYAPTEAPASRKTTVEDLAADALALIDALGEREAVLVGHDWGAATVYLATALAPERIRRMVAIGIPHLATIKPSLRLLWLGRHFITLRLPGAAARARRNGFELIDELYRRWSPTWEFGPEETAHVKACFADERSLDAALGYYRGAQPGYVPPALRGKIEVPTLAVAGEHDPALEVDVYRAAARKFSGRYEVTALPGGHFVHRESEAAFCDAVLDFLGE